METLIYDSAVQKTVSLDPSELGDVKNNVLKKINETLLWWDDTLNGIVLGYRRVKVTKRGLGFVEVGSYVHYTVKYVVTYFKPEKGKLCMGKVINVSETGINLLVLDLINTKILEPEDESDAEQDVKEKIQKLKVVEGDMVQFRIEDIQASNNAIMLFGTIPDKK